MRLSLVHVLLAVSLCSAFTVPLNRKINRSRWQMDKADGITVPLDGGITVAGEYYATITLGTPPQTFELQVDTGSTDLLVNTISCTGCGDKAPFVPDKSTSFTSVPCQNVSDITCFGCWPSSQSQCGFGDTYGDNATVLGYVAQDIFQIGNLSSVVTFGCILDSTPNFEPKSVDGIWGLAYQKLSSWEGIPVFESIVQTQNLYNSFSMCLGAEAGEMELGIDHSATPGFQWTPIVDEEWYVVQVNDMQIGGVSLGLSFDDYNSGVTIIDSGTTLLLVPDVVYSSIQDALESMCSTVYLVGVCGNSDESLFNGYGFVMSDSDAAKFPNISIVFNGTTALSISWQQYLLKEKKYYGLGIEPAGSEFIIGDVFMQNFKTVFDVEKQQIGFGAFSMCPELKKKLNIWIIIGPIMGGVALIIIIIAIVVGVSRRNQAQAGFGYSQVPQVQG